MCGRFAAFRDAEDLADEFAIALVADDARLLPPSWNVAPTTAVRIVVERGERSSDDVVRSLRVARWGLVPPWSKDASAGARMINARAETVAEKPSFRRAFGARRCIVPVDGYYEWRRTTSGKQPYRITPPGDGITPLAGLYEFWRDPEKADDDPARWLVSTTIVTRAAEGALAEIHDRTPLTLARADYARWLDPTVPGDDVRDLLAAPGVELEAYPVAARVGSVGQNDPGLLERIEV
ncbi:Putative SOS response-associated peptidase YedK [Paraoerskovia marina]|uniref:Abasic site processing protein n=1 Tax=Paraoerskovia marina TaxID=545619 RepID=A0A1H1UI76_9CELL|nr:SOS response-associated peptidase [Paraoerskovia marina]SDS72168.1 Putative SOS response-associated peptidase YedK [Paraoerskovia marina]